MGQTRANQTLLDSNRELYLHHFFTRHKSPGYDIFAAQTVHSSAHPAATSVAYVPPHLHIALVVSLGRHFVGVLELVRGG